MSGRRASAIALLALALLVPRTRAHGQQVAYAAAPMTELDSTTRAALADEMGRARARGIPVEPLMAKVREGVVKRAAPSRIRGAVAALAVRLDSARGALGAASRTAEVVAGADALAVGADASALKAVSAAAGARDRAAPLGALAQLVASGVPVRRATEFIVDLLKRNADAKQVLAFGNAVEADVGAGVPAEESAVFRRLRSIEALGIGGDKVTVAGPGDVLLGTEGTPRPAPKPKRKP